MGTKWQHLQLLFTLLLNAQTSKQVTWCFMPSQPVRLYQGKKLSKNKIKTSKTIACIFCFPAPIKRASATSSVQFPLMKHFDRI